MRILLTRHGETLENKKGILQGHLPGTLSPLGIEQAKKLAEELKKERLDHIFSSDLLRASDTAREICKYHGDVPLEFTEKLRERFLGELQGVEKEKIGITKKKLVAGTINTNLGETQEEMFKRAKEFLFYLIDNFQDKNILIVAHGGINIALMANILNKTFREYFDIDVQPNCAISIFNLKDRKNPLIELWHSVDHLK